MSTISNKEAVRIIEKVENLLRKGYSVEIKQKANGHLTVYKVQKAIEEELTA